MPNKKVEAYGVTAVERPSISLTKVSTRPRSVIKFFLKQN